MHYFAVSKMNKKSCVLCRNFISIYKIHKPLHGRLGIRIVSSRAESISHSFASLIRERYFQHSKVKFVSTRGHVISYIYNFFSRKRKLCWLLKMWINYHLIIHLWFGFKTRDAVFFQISQELYSKIKNTMKGFSTGS